VRTGTTSRHLESTLTSTSSDGSTVQDHCLKLLDAVFDFPMADGASKFMLEANPSIAWLGHCLQRCPLPPCWSALESRCGREDLRYVDMNTGAITDAPPLMQEFVDLARVMLFCRGNPSQADFVIDRLKVKHREHLADAEFARTTWNGPHMDPSTGSEYWYCPATGRSTWGDPGAANDYLARVIDKLMRTIPNEISVKAPASQRNSARGPGSQWSTLPQWMYESTPSTSRVHSSKESTLIDVGVSICQDRANNKVRHGRARSASLGALPADDTKQLWWSSGMTDPFEGGGVPQHDVVLRPESRRRRPQSCERLEPISQPQTPSMSSRSQDNPKSRDAGRQQLKREEVVEGYSYIGKYATEPAKPAAEVLQTFKGFEAENHMKKIPPPPPPPLSARQSSTVEKSRELTASKNYPAEIVSGELPQTPSMSQECASFKFSQSISKEQDITPSPQGSSSTCSDVSSAGNPVTTRVSYTLEATEPVYQCINYDEGSVNVEKKFEECSSQTTLYQNQAALQTSTHPKDDISPLAVDRVVQELDVVFAGSSCQSRESSTLPDNAPNRYHLEGVTDWFESGSTPVSTNKSIALLDSCSKADDIPQCIEAEKKQYNLQAEAQKLENDRLDAESAAAEQARRQDEECKAADEAKLEEEERHKAKAEEERLQAENLKTEEIRLIAEAAAEKARKRAEEEEQAEAERKVLEEMEAKKKSEEERLTAEAAAEATRKKTEEHRLALEEQESKKQAEGDCLAAEEVAVDNSRKTVEEGCMAEVERKAQEERGAEIKAEEEGSVAEAIAAEVFENKAHEEHKAEEQCDIQEDEEVKKNTDGERLVAEPTEAEEECKDQEEEDLKAQAERDRLDADEEANNGAGEEVKVLNVSEAEELKNEEPEEQLVSEAAEHASETDIDIASRLQVDPSTDARENVGHDSTCTSVHTCATEHRVDPAVHEIGVVGTRREDSCIVLEDQKDEVAMVPENGGHESNEDGANGESKREACSNENIEVPTAEHMSLSFADLSQLERDIASESMHELAVKSNAGTIVFPRDEPSLTDDVSIIDAELQANTRAPLDFTIKSNDRIGFISNGSDAKHNSLSELSDEEQSYALSDVNAKEIGLKAENSSITDDACVSTHVVAKPLTQAASSTSIPVELPQQQRVRESALTWVEEVAYGKKCRGMDVIEDLIWGPAPEFESSPCDSSNESEGAHAEQRKQNNAGQALANNHRIGIVSPTASMPARPKRPPRGSAYRSNSREMPRLPGASEDEPPLASVEDGESISKNPVAPSLKGSRPRGCARVVGHRMAPVGGA